jgi:hypothetical protein
MVIAILLAVGAVCSPLVVRVSARVAARCDDERRERRWSLAGGYGSSSSSSSSRNLANT